MPLAAGPCEATWRKARAIRRVLIIDEFGSSMHPMITRMLISLFNSKESNPMGAQLIFTTHDTNLLDNKFLRRDQIWFTEKDASDKDMPFLFIRIWIRLEVIPSTMNWKSS